MRLIFVVLLCTFLVLTMGGSVIADHGGWNLHRYTVQDPSPCCYKGWTRLTADDDFDYGFARFRLYYADSGNEIHNVRVTCGPVNEGCGPVVRTPEKNWSQGSPQKVVESIVCGKDGSHELAGDGFLFEPCTSEGILPHRHTSAPFT